MQELSFNHIIKSLLRQYFGSSKNNPSTSTHTCHTNLIVINFKFFRIVIDVGYSKSKILLAGREFGLRSFSIIYAKNCTIQINCYKTHLRFAHLRVKKARTTSMGVYICWLINMLIWLDNVNCYVDVIFHFELKWRDFTFFLDFCEDDRILLLHQSLLIFHHFLHVGQIFTCNF